MSSESDRDMGASPSGDRAAGLRPQPPAASSQSSIPSAGSKLRRARKGFRRIERSDSWYGGWVARGADGYRLAWGDDFEWRTRSVAWHVCLEDDLFGGPEKRAASAVEARIVEQSK